MVQKKKAKSNGFEVTTEYMTPKQIEDIRAEIDDIKNMIHARDEHRTSDIGYFDHATSHLNIDEVKQAITAREKQLKKYTPKKLAGKDSNKALARVKVLDKWIRENIPKTTYATFPRSKDSTIKASNFEKAVQAQMKWKESGQKAINEYHSLMRQIDPDAPLKDFNRYVRERA